MHIFTLGIGTLISIIIDNDFVSDKIKILESVLIP